MSSGVSYDSEKDKVSQPGYAEGRKAGLEDVRLEKWHPARSSPITWFKPEYVQAYRDGYFSAQGNWNG